MTATSRVTLTTPRRVGLLAAVGMLAVWPARPTGSVPQELTVVETVVGEMARGTSLEMARSSDRHLAWVEKRGRAVVVRLDGTAVGVPYQDVAELRLSADDEHLAFLAKRGKQWFLVIDGEERLGPYDRLFGLTLGADATQYAVSACSRKTCRLVLNGEALDATFEAVSKAVLTADWQHHAYFGTRSDKVFLQVDGQTVGPPLDDYASVRLSNDGQRVVAAVRIDDDWTWVVNGVAGPGFQAISPIAFSPDDRHFAYGGAGASTSFAKNQARGAVVEDGKVIGEYEGRGFGAGVLGMFGGMTSTMTGGLRNLNPDFHGVSDPRYTSKGTLVYAARRGADDVVVIEAGVPGPSFEDIVSPIGLSLDGEHMVYVAQRGDEFVEVRDHEAGASFPGKRQESYVGQLLTGGACEHVAFEIVRCGRARTGRCLRRVVIDGRAGPEYDAFDITDLEISADAGRYHYRVDGAEGRRDLVVFNGLQTRLYDAVFRGSVDALEDRTIEFVARDGQRFLNVRVTLEQSAALAPPWLSGF